MKDTRANKKLNLKYRLQLTEEEDGKWRLDVFYGKQLKSVFFDRFENAVKELHRAYELRTMRYKDAAKILRKIL